MKKLLFISTLFLIFSWKHEKVSKKIADATEINNEWLVFDGSSADSKHIVLVSGDEEYRSEEGLPQLAKILSKHHGFKCTVLFAQNPEKPGIIDANYVKNISGLEALASADMMVLFTRFRALPDEQMQHFETFLKAGKPVLGIRTATHAFNFQKDSLSNFKKYGNYYQGELIEWQDGFGRLVLGEKWHTHHGHHKHQSTRGVFPETDESMVPVGLFGLQMYFGAQQMFMGCVYHFLMIANPLF